MAELRTQYIIELLKQGNGAQEAIAELQRFQTQAERTAAETRRFAEESQRLLEPIALLRRG